MTQAEIDKLMKRLEAAEKRVDRAAAVNQIVLSCLRDAQDLANKFLIEFTKRIQKALDEYEKEMAK